YLAQRRDDDLSWWRLRHRSRATGTVVAVTVGIIAGVAFGAGAGTFGLAAALRHRVAYGLVFAVVVGGCQALVWRHDPPVDGRSGRLPRGLSERITCVAGGLAAGVAGGVFAGLASRVLGAPLGFAVLGLLVGLTWIMLTTGRQAARAGAL